MAVTVLLSMPMDAAKNIWCMLMRHLSARGQVSVML
jgi:hypothetical protein